MKIGDKVKIIGNKSPYDLNLKVLIGMTGTIDAINHGLLKILEEQKEKINWGDGDCYPIDIQFDIDEIEDAGLNGDYYNVPFAPCEIELIDLTADEYNKRNFI